MKGIFEIGVNEPTPTQIYLPLFTKFVKVSLEYAQLDPQDFGTVSRSAYSN